MDNAWSDLANDQKCAQSVSYATSVNPRANYREAGRWSNVPKGCFIYDSGSMFFNSYSSGKAKSDARSICLKGT